MSDTLQIDRRFRSQATKVKARRLRLTGYDIAVLKAMVRKHWIPTASMQRIYSELTKAKRRGDF